MTDRVEKKLFDVTQELMKRYRSELPIHTTLYRLALKNPDLPVASVNAWSRLVFNKSARMYFERIGLFAIGEKNSSSKRAVDWSIISKFSQQSQHNKKQRRPVSIPTLHVQYIQTEDGEIFGNSKVEPLFIQHRQYFVEELDVSGSEAADWAISEPFEFRDGIDGICLEDYTGNADRIVLPVSINGIKISRIKNFGFQQCKAKTVEIPGYYTDIPEMMFYNLNSAQN